MKAMMSEFKQFAMRGNVIDMAVGVIIGAAFGKIATSLVNDVIMPPISILLGSGQFEGLTWVLRPAIDDKPAVALNLGAFVTTVLDFLIVAFVIFMVVKQINRLKAKSAPTQAPASPTTKECPRCISTIPLKASRCPNCTSDI
ncbi:MAG: MscL: large-conductance mechanosensitive channel [Pseudomonadota bacterium]|jgi:large conductance mechanosensitive channel